MQYVNATFSVPVGGPAYSDGWERTFKGDTEQLDRVDEDPQVPLGLSRVQRRIREWARYNFPDKPSWQPLLGVAEEVGELCHAHLKNAQGIRGTPEEWTAKKMDAIGDVLIYLMDYANKEGLDVEECLNMALNEISSRDWIRYPLTGKPPTE